MNECEWTQNQGQGARYVEESARVWACGVTLLGKIHRSFVWAGSEGGVGFHQVEKESNDI